MGLELINFSNDLAGGVSADLCVTRSVLCHDEANEDAKIYSACAVARAMVKAKNSR